MKSLLAFIHKEMLEQRRSGKLIILGILFVVLGIMSPAIAKLTPWLMEMMADSLAGSGLIFTSVSVTAMDSWVQFFKNMPIGLIAFVLIESSIFTREYQTGTLLLSLTKGLERHKVVAAKAVVLVFLWTICYWLCAGITCGYTADLLVGVRAVCCRADGFVLHYGRVKYRRTGRNRQRGACFLPAQLLFRAEKVYADDADGWDIPDIRHGGAKGLYSAAGHRSSDDTGVPCGQRFRIQQKTIVRSIIDKQIWFLCEPDLFL